MLISQPNNYKITRITAFELIGASGVLKNDGYYEDHMIPKYGYSLGVGVIHTFSKSFDLSLRCLWETKGSKVKIEGISIDTNQNQSILLREYNTSYKYISLPLVSTFRIGSKKNLFIGGGAYYSFLKKASIGVKEIDPTQNLSTNYTIKDLRNFKVKYDFGLSIFAGHTFKLKNQDYLSAQFVYNRGFVDITDVWNLNQRNNSFMLSVSFGFANPFNIKH